MNTKNRQTIYSLFRQQVEQHPDALAVMDDRRQLSFKELDHLVDTIASRFLCNRPSFIGIVMDHDVELIASILAALKVGAAYVPAEPSFPVERIRYMMKECDVDFLIPHESMLPTSTTAFANCSLRRDNQSVPIFTSTTCRNPTVLHTCSILLVPLANPKV